MTASTSGWVAVVTARGGSKGIPGKNLRLLAGKPLLVHSIEAALDSERFDGVIINSDDDEILRVGAAAGAEPQKRPPELATDTSNHIDVLLHGLEPLAARFRRFALLQPTSPLRRGRHLREAIDRYEAEDLATMVSVVGWSHPPQKSFVLRDGKVVPLIDKATMTQPRQALEPAFRVNGAIYLAEIEAFLKRRDLFEDPLGVYEMSAEDSIDIDTQVDLTRAEAILGHE